MPQYREHVRPPASASAVSRLVRTRKGTALALIGFMSALAVLMIATLGVVIAPFVLFPLIPAYSLIWMSADELRADEGAYRSEELSPDMLGTKYTIDVPG